MRNVSWLVLAVFGLVVQGGRARAAAPESALRPGFEQDVERALCGDDGACGVYAGWAHVTTSLGPECALRLELQDPRSANRARFRIAPAPSGGALAITAEDADQPAAVVARLEASLRESLRIAALPDVFSRACSGTVGHGDVLRPAIETLEKERTVWHERPEPALRTLVRKMGPLGWLGLLWGGLLLVGGLLWLVRRRRDAERGRRRGFALVVAGLVAGATVGGAFLLAHFAERLLPPYPARRGTAPAELAPIQSGYDGLYTWGGSTVLGEPFFTVSLPMIIHWSLGGQLGERSLRTVNLAEPGLAVTVHGPERVMTVLAAPELYRPRVVVISTGHNEYGSRRNAQHTLDDFAAEQAEVEALYDAGLREIAVRARAAGALLVLCVPVSNIDGVPPQFSAHTPETSPPERARAEASVARAVDALAANDPVSAHVNAREAVAASAGFARAHYVLAQALYGLDRDAEAQDAAARAVQLDQGGNRARPSQNALVRRICAEGLAVCVDVEPELRRRYRRLDDHLFVDVHHPRMRVHYVLGAAVASAIAQALELPDPAPIDPEDPPRELLIDDEDAEALRHTVGWFVQNAGWAHMDDFAREDALRRVETGLAAWEARGIETDERRRLFAIRRAALLTLRGRPDEAQSWVRQALDGTESEQIREVARAHNLSLSP